MHKPYTQEELAIKDSIQEVRDLFANRGVNSDNVKLSIKDTLATPNMPMAFKRVIEEYVIDAIEPNLIGASLLQKISMDPSITQVKFRTFSAAHMDDLSMGEAGEYPELSLTQGGGQVFTSIGKYGVAVRITDEMIEQSQWDIIGQHLRKIGYVMARDKEKNIFNMINSVGVTVFDNDNPNESLLGRTTGRDLTGAGNGSFTADDMYDMYASILERGYNPDVILCHPLAWATFTKDPVLREYAMQSGGLGNWFSSMPNPSALQGSWLPNVWKNFNRMSGTPPFDPTRVEREGTQTSTFQLPSYFPGTNIRIIASPFVPFDAEKKTTSIIMVDTRELGAIFVTEEPTMTEWRDFARDMQKIQVRERYGLAIFNEGQAIAVAKNVSIEPNEIVLPPQAIVNSIPRIQRKDPQ